MRPIALALLGGLAACSSIAVPERRLSEDPAILQQVEATAQRGTRPGVAVGLDGRPMPLEDLPVVRSVAVERELRRILDGVIAAWPGPRPPPVTLFITSQTGYTASTSEENHIFVSLGVLASSVHEDEIAFLLAHELTHAMLGHTVERRVRGQRTRFAARMTAQAVQYGTVLANSTLSGTAQGGYRLNPRLGPGDLNTLMAVGASSDIISQLMVDFGDARTSRRQETQADRNGLDLMARGRYDSTRVGAVYQNLEAYEASRGQRRALLRGTVTNAVRLAGRLGAAQAPQVQGGSNLGGLLPTLSDLFAPSMEKAMESLLGSEMLDRYEPLSLRREALQEYEKRHWPAAAENASRPSRFRQGAFLAEVNGERAAIAAYERAKQAAADGDVAGADAAARDPDLIRRAPLLHRMAQSELLMARGDIAGAAATLRPVLASQDATPGVFAKAADLHSRLGEHGRALQLLDEGERRFRTREPFLNTRVYVLSMAKRDQDVRQAIEDCDRVEDPEISRACRASMREDAPANLPAANQRPGAAPRWRIPGF